MDSRLKDRDQRFVFFWLRALGLRSDFFQFENAIILLILLMLRSDS